MAEPIKTMTITVRQDRRGAAVDIGGDVTPRGLAFLQMTLAHELSSRLGEKDGDDAHLLQGQIANAAGRLAGLMRIAQIAHEVREPSGAEPIARGFVPSGPVLRRLCAVALSMLSLLFAVGVADWAWIDSGFYIVALWLGAAALCAAIAVIMILRAARRGWRRA